MELVTAFNDLLKSALQEVSAALPDHVVLKVFLRTFDAVVRAAPAAAMDAFKAAVGPHVAALAAAAPDPAVVQALVVVPGLDLGSVWPRLDEAQRLGVWQAMQQLYMVASLHAALPQPMLATLDKVAGAVRQQAGGAEVDLNDLPRIMMQLMQSEELGAMVGGLLGGAAAGQPPARQQPAPRKTKKLKKKA